MGGTNPAGRPARNPNAAPDPSTGPDRSGSLAREIHAYPGTITFRDLIRKNKRQSVLLILLMLGLGAIVGAALGAVVGAYAGGAARPEDLLPSLALGLIAALIVGGLGATWSWFSGSSAILRMMGAKEVGPQEDPVLYNVVDEMRIAAGLPMPRVYLINDTALNAFATGRDPEHGVVAVTKGLRDMLPRDELQAVVAHEMSHIRHLDIRFAMLMATMVGIIVFACDAFWRMVWHSGRYARAGRRSGGGKDGGGAAIVVIIVLAVLLAIIAPLFARLIQMAYSREREYLADAGAVELTRDPEALARALARIAGDAEPLVEAANRGTAHMFIANPLRKMREAHQNLDSMFASHPPMQKRIARILALTR